VFDSVEMVNPDGHAQEKPPMILLHECEQGESTAHSSSSKKKKNHSDHIL